MKKFFLIVFTLFTAFIFYQLILSKNGLIEEYRTAEEKKHYLYYKNILLQEKERLFNYINFLKNDKNALLFMANKMGFTKDSDNGFIRIIDEMEKYSKNELSIEYIEDNIENIIRNNSFNVKLNRIKLIITILFFIFFGTFIFLLIFSGEGPK